MKFYLSIVSLFLISLGTTYAESPELELPKASGVGPEFSFATGELNIPTVIVDGETLYSVKMQLLNTEEGMIFSLVNATGLQSFEKRFETVTNNMSREDVKIKLGMPQDISFDLEIKAGAFCSEPQLELGSIYEAWRYFVDSESQEPSGFVVWFAKNEGVSEDLVVVGKVNGFSCM